MKRIRNIILQSLSALVMCSSLCASPELISAEAQKSKFLKKMISIIDCGPGQAIGVFREGNQAICVEYGQFVSDFQECYDDYRACFPQGDLEVDKALKKHLEMRIKEKMAAIGKLEEESIIKTKQINKGFLRNLNAGYATLGTIAMLASYALYQLGKGENLGLELIYSICSGIALGGAGILYMKSLTEPDEIARAANYLNIQLEVGNKEFTQLHEVYSDAILTKRNTGEVL